MYDASLRRFAFPLAYGLSTLLVGSMLAAPAFAHDTLPAKWCLDPNTAPVALFEFDIAPIELASYRRSNPILKNPPEDVQCGDERSCGIVDDWFWADQMSREICAAQQEAPQMPEADGRARAAQTPQGPQAMPFVRSPVEFNATEHHKRYRFNSGHLHGACVVCVPVAAPSPAPTPSADNER